jgi:glycosyltransferase involved in cell wall biosynthesis
MNLIFGGLAVLFLGMTILTLFHLRWVHRLPQAGDLPSALSGNNVRCSVILPARNEEARIEKTIRNLAAQREVDLEIIVVDDRSTDRTTPILRDLSREIPNLHVVRVDVLPEGWLGKCHACHLGASKATGEWLLFTDADCWLKADVLSRALRVATREQADHIVLTPGVAPESLAAAAWHLAFLITLADWVAGVNRDNPKTYLGMGAFNFVRAAAYRASGGYEALRLTVLDDVKLGFLLRRAGKRTRGFIGGDDVLCHWGSTLRNMIAVMEKNYFATVSYRTSIGLCAGLGGLLLWMLGLLAPFTGTPRGITAGLALYSLALPSVILARRLGWKLPCALVTPFIFLALFYAILNSLFVTLRQGGVRWRDTFYSLKTLREHEVR